MRILITGGAGFVGSHLARLYRQEAGAEVVVLDNLKRRGSERNLALLAQWGVPFFHGDIRSPGDLQSLPGNFDLLVEASAEPSVHAGAGPKGSPDYLLQTNLVGTMHCLEFARARVGALLFLSTSRVYSLEPLLRLPLREGATRLEPTETNSPPGFSSHGISEDFSVATARSLYGASKLCSEILLQEYVHTYKLNALVNRCGVIAGAGQFGKVDQGVFTLWLAHHHFGKPLRYTGFGGKGLQVRDLLHPTDLFRLLQKQLPTLHQHNGAIFNVGGGQKVSTSLREWTDHARAATGRSIEIGEEPNTAAVDIPYYTSDFRRAEGAFQWRPEIGTREIALDIAGWLKENERSLQPIFG